MLGHGFCLRGQAFLPINIASTLSNYYNSFIICDGNCLT